ncbi:hypothetical protein RND81_04G142300 [Saponaria officinalis]|uniref:Uncharacterized protein n=1 Tax=Saponaria officinalis TaxID=3572 RepID=A0AAW1LL62_SAPOF
MICSFSLSADVRRRPLHLHLQSTHHHNTTKHNTTAPPHTTTSHHTHYPNPCTTMMMMKMKMKVENSSFRSSDIPSQICDWSPFLVTLDLSGNVFSGPIPSQIGNCRFLNSIDLSGNRLSGMIPVELAGLDRLKKLDLGDNQLSGLVPVVRNLKVVVVGGVVEVTVDLTSLKLCGRKMKK